MKGATHITLSIIVICVVMFCFWREFRPWCYCCHEKIIGKVYEKCGYNLDGDYKTVIYFRTLCKECIIER